MRRFFAAFFAQDRDAFEALLAPGFTFSSPRDDRTPLDEAKQYLDRVSAEWEQALNRLKAFVER